MSTPPLDILISGTGIAGPCLAFWLVKFIPTCRITILERFPAPRLGGQAIDLRSSSVPIVRKMGLMEKVKDKHTTETGIQFVYADGVTKATFDATGNEENQSMTSEYEILRGDLARIFYDETKSFPNITYVFDEMITEIEELPTNKVSVKFKNNHVDTTEYDLVVGADGMLSRTRRLVFGRGPKNDDHLYRLGQYSALFTMPREPSDSSYAQWYNAPNGRLLFLRPDRYNRTHVYMAVTDANLTRFDKIDRLHRGGTRDEQMEWFEREFQGAGFQTERCLREMRRTDDFYMQQIAQVKMPSWIKGHVALVGDAAYCPSPISGVGAGAAIVGAYVLAGEISKSPHDIPAALNEYDRIARQYVNIAQKLVPGAPQIANPQTEWGIKFFNTFTGAISHPYAKRFGQLVGKWVPAFGATTDWAPPNYGDTE